MKYLFIYINTRFFLSFTIGTKHILLFANLFYRNNFK